ncbi:hypothetical protein BJ170DRAFT_722070 [Xylariales sp. AK1849]|nr:hypothetical protein BJ170DRAFT_722070 [Xylariales sp. AK1849]
MESKKGITRWNDYEDRLEDLSIAAELKFLVPFLPHAAAGLDDHVEPRMHIAKFIETAKDVRQKDKLKLWAHAFSGIANVIKTVPGQDASTSYDLERQKIQESDCWARRWIVKKSNSAEPMKEDAHREDYLWVPVEITSPRMAWKDPNTFDIMEKVLEALRTKYRLVSNYTCEVHVHVGRMDGRPFSLPTLKNIAVLLWIAEPILRKVKDPSSPNFQHVYTWSSAAREHSRLAMDIRDGKVAHPATPHDLEGTTGVLNRYLVNSNVKSCHNLDAVRLIVSTQSHLELGRLMSGEGRPYRRLGFNFSAFGEEDERARTNPRTVECRFLEGSIDGGVILGWMQIFGTMIEVALDQPESKGCFKRSLSRLLMDEEDHKTAEEAFKVLMDRLGVPKDVYGPVQAMVRELPPEFRKRGEGNSH